MLSHLTRKSSALQLQIEADHLSPLLPMDTTHSYKDHPVTQWINTGSAKLVYLLKPTIRHILSELAWLQFILASVA
jgi:hypothetical protein